jgi:predicted unusual protein kinase regulating ubiquinone biosynthesis (AarF/ABC1/UbiB family)
MSLAAARTGAGVLAGALAGRSGAGLGKADLDTIEHLVASLGDLKGVAMKLGQIFSYIDESVPPEARRLLTLLQTDSQPDDPRVIEEVLRNELGKKADQILATFDPIPVSVPSIGQVHRARLPDGTAVAVKVQHPGIESAVRADFKAAGAGETFARLMPGGGRTIRESIEEVRARLLEECDYTLEAERQMTFRRLYAKHSVVVVPAVHRAFSTRRVLTTTWEGGVDLETYLAEEPSLEERSGAGRALFELYVGTLYRHRLFHADPHPGNYRFRRHGRVIVYDYGCVREFDAPTVSALAALSRAVRRDERGAMVEALESLGARHVREDRDFAAVRALLRGFFAPLLQSGAHAIAPGSALEIASILRDKRALVRIELPGKLLFLFRIRFGLYAVLARLGAVCDWAELEESFLTDV